MANDSEDHDGSAAGPADGAPAEGAPEEVTTPGASAAAGAAAGEALDLSAEETAEGGDFDEIDLTVADEVPPQGEDWGSGVVTQSYELAVKREDMRGKLAFGLLLLLAVVVLMSFATVWIRRDLTPEVKDLLTLIFGPVVTLVGAATGYYFGGRGKAGDEPSS